MKRKGVNAGKLRLSPNEEAFILKEDYERRRKLRLLQVRFIWNIVSTSLCPPNYSYFLHCSYCVKSLSCV